MSEENTHRSLKLLAGLGAYGSHPQNIKPELVILLGKPTTPSPCVIDVPMVALKTPTEERKSDEPFPIMLPHELFHMYYHKYPVRFADLFLGGKAIDELPKFWGELKKRGMGAWLRTRWWLLLRGSDRLCH